MSMDSNGKIIFAKHSEIQQANLKNIAGKFKHTPITYTLYSMLHMTLNSTVCCKNWYPAFKPLLTSN